MKVRLFASPNYDFIWPDEPNLEADPQAKSFPEEEKIKLKCKRLTRAERRRIEDSMMTMKDDALKQGKKRSQQSREMTVSYHIGTVKERRILISVTGWENVLDEDGKPIVFSQDKLQLLLDQNAGLDSAIWGVLETDLLERIDQENTFAESSTVTAKN